MSVTSEAIPEMMRAALLVLARHWQALDADERAVERQIAKAARRDHDARRPMEVPGVGPIIASTVSAKVPDARLFRSGRDFAARSGSSRLTHRFLDPPSGRTIPLYQCECGQRIWDD